jgi:hypothetical protein
LHNGFFSGRTDITAPHEPNYGLTPLTLTEVLGLLLETAEKLGALIAV